MDFLACLCRSGLPSQGMDHQFNRMENRANQLGLVRITNGPVSLPFWAKMPSAWHTHILDNGNWVIGRDAKIESSKRNFETICSSPRTGPVIEFAPDLSGRRIAADQLGIATIYWTDIQETLLAASRSEYLVERCDRHLNLEAVFHFLNFSAVPTPYSILDGVRRLGAGKSLSIAETIHEDTFWDLQYGGSKDASQDTRPDVLYNQIRSAVKKTITGLNISTTGAFLSGGTDSTTVAGMTTDIFQSELDVFSIVFEEQTFSEEPFMRAAAARFPLRRHTFQLDQAAFMRALEPINKTYDEPYANSSVYAAYYCFLLAQQAGKQYLLAGDGGDEIFGGNERYFTDRALQSYASIPSGLRAGLEWPIKVWPFRSQTANRLRKIFRRAQLPNPDRFYADMEFASAHWSELPGTAFSKHPIVADKSLMHIRNLYRSCSAEDQLHRLLYLDMKLTIADNDLRKIVGCGTIFGIEPKFPFLDLELVEFVNSLPSSVKLRRTQKRFLFKKAMRGYLPDKILFKPKQGMGIPLGRWLREAGPVASYAKERLEDSIADTLFNRRYLKTIWDQHQRGEWDYGEDLWRIVVLVDWCSQHMGGSFAS